MKADFGGGANFEEEFDELYENVELSEPKRGPEAPNEIVEEKTHDSSDLPFSADVQQDNANAERRFSVKDMPQIARWETALQQHLPTEDFKEFKSSVLDKIRRNIRDSMYHLAENPSIRSPFNLTGSFGGAHISRKTSLQKVMGTQTIFGAHRSNCNLHATTIDNPKYNSGEGYPIHVRMRHDIIHGIMPEHHQTVNWVNLYFDLIYVAAIIKFSDSIANEIENTHSLLLAFTLFLVIWEETVLVENRFEFLGFWLKFIMKFSFIFHGALVLGIGINSVHIMDERHFSAMFYFYAIAWAQTSFLYLFMFRTIEAAEDHCNFFGVCHVILSICAFFIGMYVDSDNAEVCFFILLALVLMCHFCTIFVRSLQLSINLHHYTERHGLLIIILLGEGIISMVTPPVAVDLDQYILVFGGYLAISCIYFLYFEFQPKKINLHGLRANGRAILWMMSHILLHPAILAMCIGFKMMVKYQVKYYIYEQGGYDGRRMLGPEPSPASSNYGANPYGEFATVKQEKLLYWGLFASFQLIGMQWFSHFFYWRKVCDSSKFKENLIILAWLLHSIALLFPAWFPRELTRVELVCTEAAICFSGLFTVTLFEVFAGTHMQENSDEESESEISVEEQLERALHKAESKPPTGVGLRQITRNAERKTTRAKSQKSRQSFNIHTDVAAHERTLYSDIDE